jgi:hypothetical protein
MTVEDLIDQYYQQTENIQDKKPWEECKAKLISFMSREGINYIYYRDHELFILKHNDIQHMICSNAKDCVL